MAGLTYPVIANSQGSGELLRTQLTNLGITPPTSMGAGELSALLANAASIGSAVGGFNLGPNAAAAGTVAQTLARPAITSNAVALPTTGILQMNAIWLMQGQVISTMNWASGATPGATLTHQWLALCNGPTALTGAVTAAAYAYLAVTQDLTNAAISASSILNYNIYYTLSNPSAGSAISFTVPQTGLYFACLMVANSSAQPSAAGITNSFTHVSTLPPILAGSSGTGFTTPPVPGTTAAPSAPTPSGAIPYIWLT